MINLYKTFKFKKYVFNCCREIPASSKPAEGESGDGEPSNKKAKVIMDTTVTVKKVRNQLVDRKCYIVHHFCFNVSVYYSTASYGWTTKFVSVNLI